MSIRWDWSLESKEGGIRVYSLWLLLSHVLPKINQLNHTWNYLSTMDWSIINDNNWSGAWIGCAERKYIVSNEVFEPFCIDSAFVQVAGHVSVNCQCRKKAKVAWTLPTDLVMDNLAFFRVAVASFPQLWVDPWFVDKNELISMPIPKLLKPMVPQLRITFLCFLLKL